MLAAPYWQARWPGRVTSNAVGGTNSVQLLAGTDGLNKPWPESVGAAVVVIKHGTNDGTPAYGVTPIDTYKANLRAFASIPQFVIFETPDPNTDPSRDAAIPAYTQAMREVAAELHVPLIDTDACWRAHTGWEGFLTDGTHASPEGRQFTVDACVAPVIEAITCR